jgi:hypothetical protein
LFLEGERFLFSAAHPHFAAVQEHFAQRRVCQLAVLQFLLFQQMPNAGEQSLYLNEAERRSSLQVVNVGRILAFHALLISQTENQRDLIKK